jgi:hypothetical protein
MYHEIKFDEKEQAQVPLKGLFEKEMAEERNALSDDDPIGDLEKIVKGE